MQYSDVVLHYFFAANHAGVLAAGEQNSFTVKVGNAATGIIQLQVKLAKNPAAAVLIADARFLAHGCPATIACAAWLAEYMQKKTITEIQQCTSSKIVSELHLNKEKIHCALLAEDAVKEIYSQQLNFRRGVKL